MEFDWGSLADLWGSYGMSSTVPQPKWMDYDPLEGADAQGLNPDYWGAAANADVSPLASAALPDAPVSYQGNDNSWDKYLTDTYTSPAVQAISRYEPAGAAPAEPTWYENVGSKIASGAGKVGGGALDYGLRNAVPIGMGLLGAGLQGSADKDASLLAKQREEAKNKALATGATNYMAALQTGKDEAKSSYLQNVAAQKGALAEKLARNTADSGGANPRRTMDKFTRSSNEGYGNFLLNLAQQKMPGLDAYTAQAGGGIDVPAEDWWTGAKKGAASTLGTLVGNDQTMALLNAIYGNRS